MPLFVHIGQRYLIAKNKPKYSNILHVLEVSTIFTPNVDRIIHVSYESFLGVKNYVI